MNWTGGNLQRHSRGASKQLTQRQKAHFARVRQRLGNPSAPPSDFIPLSLFDPRDRHDRRHVRHATSIAVHAKAKVIGTKRGQSSAAPSTHIKQEHDCGSIHEKMRGNARAREEFTSRGAVSISSDSSDDSDIVSAAPEGTGRDASIRPTDEELIEAYRNRLLQRGDWLGLAPARPLRMNFEGLVTRDHIGKRRKVRHAKRPRMQQAEDAPSAKKHRNTDYYMSGALPVEDIQVRIGSQALASQVAGSEPQRPHVVSSMMEHIYSDSMLLGAEDVNFDAGLNATKAQLKGSSASVSSGMDHEHLTGTPTPTKQQHKGEEIHYNFSDEHQKSCSIDGTTLTDDEGHGRFQEPRRSPLHHRPLSVHSFTAGSIYCEHLERNDQTPQRGFRLIFCSTPRTGPRVLPLQLGRARSRSHEHERMVDMPHDQQSSADYHRAWHEFLDLTDENTDSNYKRFDNQQEPPQTALSVGNTEDEQPPSVSTPRGYGTQRTSTPSPATVSNTDMASEAQQNVPPSLQQWDTLIAKDVAVRPTTKIQDEGEELWRMFVFGEGEESSGSETHVHTLGALIGSHAPTQASMAVALSHSSGRVFEKTAAGRHGTPMYVERRSSSFEETGAVTPTRERSPSPGSMSNQPATVFNLLQGRDDLAVTPPASQGPMPNIHAAAEPINAPEIVARQVWRRPTVGGSRREMKRSDLKRRAREIYMLVDSDGQSLD